MVAIYHAYYNFCRVHQTVRVTPAMEAGLADHVWPISELVEVAQNTATQKVAA
jgi:enoyl-CoA hydratase/carnithine racemase